MHVNKTLLHKITFLIFLLEMPDALSSSRLHPSNETIREAQIAFGGAAPQHMSTVRLLAAMRAGKQTFLHVNGSQTQKFEAH